MNNLTTGATNQPGYYGNVAASKVELSVSCRNLLDKDTFSKSDPFCVLYMKPFNNEKFVEISRTETIMDNLNPEFSKKFVLDYLFEEVQKLKFELYDSDSNKADLKYHEFLGSLECNLSEIVSVSTLKRPLMPPPKHTKAGTITIRSEEVSKNNDLLHMEFNAKSLDKKDFFGKSDPFMEFSRSNEDGTFTVVHRTEVIKNNLNPHWKKFSLKAQQLCNGDYDRIIKVNIYDWNKSGSHSIIGSFSTCVRDLLRGPCDTNSFEVINVKKKSKKSYKNSGNVTLLYFMVEKQYSFLEFLQGGLQLHLSVAIDFTQSNGDPRQPGTLHYHTQNQYSEYGLATQCVADILKDYDSNREFIGYGFGAKLPGGEVSHCFPLSLTSNPICKSVEELLTTYYQCLTRIQLYGPTNFSPIINKVSQAAMNRPSGHYQILLIITDGIITDMENTKRALVQAAKLPVSIIIVGVGNADFEAMHELDGDDVRISYQGTCAERDIVQFVSFTGFRKKFSNLQTSQAYFAKEVLEEIPDQVCGYMNSKKLKPGTGNPVVTNANNFSVPTEPPPPYNF